MTPRLTAIDRRWLVVWFVLALALRGSVVWLLAGMLERDTDGYAQLAQNVVKHGVYGFRDGAEIRPTAFRPPLYPLLLTATIRRFEVSLGRVAVWHAALGALTVAAVWLLGRLLGLRWEAHLAALIVAIDPILLVMSPQVMTETLATFLAAAALLALVVAKTASKPIPMWALAGLLLGTAGLCRPTFLLTTALVLVAVFLTVGGKKRWLAVALVAVAAATPVAIWTLRNAVVFGRPIVATTHGGYTMLLANNPAFYEHLRSANDDVFRAAELDRTLDSLRRKNEWNELEYDRATAKTARETIANDPAGFLRAATYRMTRLFGPAPHKTDPDESPRWQAARLAVTNWYIAVLGFATLGLIGRALEARTKRRNDASPPERSGDAFAWLCMLAFLASFALLHLVYWCDLRMRAPLTPMIALATAFGFAQIRQWLSTYRRRRQARATTTANDPSGSPSNPPQ